MPVPTPSEARLGRSERVASGLDGTSPLRELMDATFHAL
jgi:hypothetical protein